MAECNRCGSEIGNADRCGCGWQRRSMRDQFRDRDTNPFPLGYQQCDWESGGQRCKYPGSISTNTHAGGPYFCRLHFACDDPVFGATVVEASRDYVREQPHEAVERITQEAQENLAKQGIVKRPGESSREYIDRLRQHCRDLSKGGILKRKAA